MVDQPAFKTYLTSLVLKEMKGKMTRCGFLSLSQTHKDCGCLNSGLRSFRVIGTHGVLVWLCYGMNKHWSGNHE